MTQPETARRPLPSPTLGLLCVIASVVMFVLAAFAFGGDSLGDVPAWTWMAGALAAWGLAKVV